MFGLPDGQIDILKGKIADIKLPYLARQREKLKMECRNEELEICLEDDKTENEEAHLNLE